MGSASVSIDKLAEAVNSTLTDYSRMAADKVADAVTAAAKFAVEQIKANAREKFAGTEKYVKSWRHKKQTNKKGVTSEIVYSNDDGNKASWLEYGHAKVNGGRTQGRPHIAPAAEATAEFLERRIREELERT